jgi:hypothetical protein
VAQLLARVTQVVGPTLCCALALAQHVVATSLCAGWPGERFAGMAAELGSLSIAAGAYVDSRARVHARRRLSSSSLGVI